MTQTYSTKGKHEIADLWGVDAYLLNNIKYLEQMCRIAIAKSGANNEGKPEKKFTPQGCTILFLLSESHLAIHASPEEGYAAVDCFTCGSHTKPEKAMDHIIEELRPDLDRSTFWTLVRGV